MMITGPELPRAMIIRYALATRIIYYNYPHVGVLRRR